MRIFANFIQILSIIVTIISFVYIVLKVLMDFFYIENDFIKSLVQKFSRHDIIDQGQKSILNKRKKKLIVETGDYIYSRSVEILKRIIPYILINRIFVFLITYGFYIAYNNKKVSLFQSFNEIWNKWDTAHYLFIAQYGYTNINQEKLFIVFYPLYPIFVRIAHIFVHNYFLSGVFVSNIFLLISLYYLYKLVEIEFNDIKMAFTSIKYVLIFPFSFFFSIAYTESLFLALTIMTFYFARKKQWIMAGFIGLLASFTRNQGILLMIPLVFEILYENEIVKHYKNKNIKKLVSDSIKIIISITLVPCGTFLYLLINKVVTGEWFKFLVYQRENWNQNLGFFPENLKNNFMNIFGMDAKLAVGVWVPQILLFFICFSLLIYMTNKIRVSYIAFSFFYIIVTYSPTWLLSGPRYISGMFTLFIMLAFLARKINMREKYIDLIMILLLCFYSIQFCLSNVF